MIRPSKEELMKLFDNQCGPCLLNPKECKGNTEQAKKWKCRKFFNGLMVI